MKYILIDRTKTDEFCEEFDDKQEAISAGEKEFSRLTKFEKLRRTAFYVLESANPDEEAENHYDGNVVKEWKRGD